MIDKLKANAGLVETLSSSIRNGGGMLGNVPGMIKRLLQEGAWREFETQRGEVVRPESFTEFVTARPLKGIGSSIEQLKDICRSDDEVLQLIEEATKRPHGGDHVTPQAKSKMNNIHLAPTPQGTSSGATLRTLGKRDPDLLKQVVQGKLTPNKAMVQAGYRKHKVQVVPAEPEQVARTLHKHMSPEDIETLKGLL